MGISYDLLAILAVVFVFVISSFKKNPLHIGIIGMCVAWFLGRVTGLTDVKIFGFFPTTLFVRLFGILFFFSISQINGTIEILAKKILSKTGRNVKLMPFFIFYTGVILSSLGVPSMAGFAVLTGLGIALALETGGSPQLFAIAAGYGTGCGVYSPMNEYTANITSACESAGLDVNLVSIYLFCLVAYSFSFLVLYLCLGGYKAQGKGDGTDVLKDLPAFNRQQIITLVGIAAILVLVMFFKVDIGWAGILVAAVAILLGASTCADALKKVSLPSLILVCGVGQLLAIVSELGGFELLGNALASIMTPKTVPPLLSLTSSTMSLFTISRLCVLTLVPTIPGILEKIPTASVAAAITGVAAGATASNIGPLSICGAMIMSNLGLQIGEEKAATYFGKQMLMGVIAAISVAFVGLVASFLGII